MKVSCVIPAYNEAEHITAVIRSVRDLVDELIVIDDCSTDNTFQVAQEAGALSVRHFVNRGQGAALRTGTHLALLRQADIIIHFDADGQFRAEDLAKLIEPLRLQQADMVLGSRFLDQSTQMPYFKRVIIMPIARIINRLLGIRLTDPQSGLRAFNRSTGLRLTWTQDRMAHCSEILYQAHRLKLIIKEVPITVLYKEFGQNISGGIRIIIDLVLAKLAN
jgi:glycosyltransferase involved in cell wall biosynthesis